ncbi:hypothetical protein BVH03_22365 [Pseudomonas sp. PA15(2017)]|nr:hypothetical protein BVH03_22365 [Pseudomonas sp. PA15(2017)]
MTSTHAAPQLFAVHAQGPDEIYPAYDRADAERHAAELNALRTPPGISVSAVVIPSPFTELEHWKYFAEQEHEHKLHLLAGVTPTDANLSAMRREGLSIDGDNAYKRDLIDTIVGALAFGKQGVNPPPTGHRGKQFWDIGRAEGEEKERLINQRDAILLQARVWSGEAKTQQAITREVGEILGGIPSWGPIAAGVEALRQQLDDAVNALNEICRVSRMGEAPFEIATLAIGEMCASAVPADHCDHEWTDDGLHLLVCTVCGAQEDQDPHWRDMATAPRDGTMVRLLVEFTEHATEDADQAPTIGANNFENDGEDRWLFAGWCWSHDHFTQGEGEPIGWLPMLNDPVCTPAQGGDGEAV